MFTRHKQRLVLILIVLLGLPIILPPVHASETVVSQVTMLNAVTALNATGTAVGSAVMSKCRESAIYIIPTTPIAAGAVQIESSHDASYSGTWAPMGSTISLTASTLSIAQITGIHLNLRVRVSTAVTGGGTVSAVFICN